MKVIAHDIKVCEKYPDYEQYACFNSYQLSDEFLKEKISLDQYVVIETHGKKIFRKCIARAGVCHNEVSLGARTRRELCVKVGDDVNISHTTWLKYRLHNSDTSVKLAFVLALLGVLCSIFSTINDFIK